MERKSKKYQILIFPIFSDQKYHCEWQYCTDSIKNLHLSWMHIHSSINNPTKSSYCPYNIHYHWKSFHIFCFYCLNYLWYSWHCNQNSGQNSNYFEYIHHLSIRYKLFYIYSIMSHNPIIFSVCCNSESQLIKILMYYRAIMWSIIRFFTHEKIESFS